MNITVTQENLSKALSNVARVANSRSTLPILSNVLLKTEGNMLVLIATNLDIAISETLGAKVTKNGATTIPAKLTQDFVASLPKGSVNIEVKDNKVAITSGRFSATINGSSPEDFPTMPEVKNGKETSFSSGTLKTALSQVLFSASSDDTRPVLAGVNINSNGEEIKLAATDSYRLSEKTIKSKTEANLILPATAMSEVLRNLDEENEVILEFDDSQARFTIGSVQIVARLIDGKYPDYQKLLPTKFATTALLKRSDLQEITKISSLFARETAGSITLVLDNEKNEVSIASIASQVGENTSSAPAEIDGESTSITINSRYALDALSVLKGEMVRIGINGKLDPLVINDPSDKSYLHVIMPVRS